MENANPQEYQGEIGQTLDKETAEKGRIQRVFRELTAFVELKGNERQPRKVSTGKTAILVKDANDRIYRISISRSSEGAEERIGNLLIRLYPDEKSAFRGEITPNYIELRAEGSAESVVAKADLGERIVNVPEAAREFLRYAGGADYYAERIEQGRSADGRIYTDDWHPMDAADGPLNDADLIRINYRADGIDHLWNIIRDGKILEGPPTDPS